jgi:pimeloyl-ACP methyl ester carboxylesterase
MPIAHVGDASIHYREAGSGNDVVLLLHAFPLHSGMWAPQLPALAGRFRVIAPDYRGLGESRPAPAATTMDLIVGDVLALLRQLGIRRVAVAGVSMGGYVAFELYRRAPGLFRGLALCNTKATPDTVEQAATREAFAQNALAKGLEWVATEFTPKLLRPGGDPTVDAAVRRLIREGTPEGVAAAQRGMARRPDSVPTLARIQCPTLVVAGEQDQLMPFGELMRIAQGVKGSRLVRVPTAGHLPNLEAPAAFNDALARFFAALPEPPAPRPDPYPEQMPE